MQIQLGLKQNWKQFALLVLVNAFVGGMVGLERTFVPLIGSQEFSIESEMIIFSFIIAFGIVKAFSNLFSGMLADRFTRKKILILGWLIGLPVPFLIGWGPSWNWIIIANILLGLSQGLAWSMTVNMKMDLVGPKKRGLAMGLNEAAGYGALGLTALLTGYIASAYGLRPEPFYIGIFYTVAGLIISVFIIRDTKGHAALEAAQVNQASSEGSILKPGMNWIFFETSWRNKNLFSISQAGLVNNMNDGMSWGVFPLLFTAVGVGLEGIGWIKAVYPIVWGLGQVITGPLADRIGRKPLIVWGMIIQAVGYLVISFGIRVPILTGIAGSILLGIGTAMVYPSLLASVSDVTHPTWRATSLGVYRFWRDIGYAMGALMAGVVAAWLGLIWAVHVAGIITFISGLIVWRTMKETMNTSVVKI